MENANLQHPPNEVAWLTGNENGNSHLPDAAYLSILDALTFPATFITPDHHYHFVNKAYGEWFGIDRASIIGKSVKEFLGPKAYSVIRPYMERALNGEFVHYGDEVSFKQQGKRFIEATYSPLIGGDGKVIGYLGLIRDITDIRKKLVERNKTELALRESEHRYRNLIQQLTAAIYTTDEKGIITMYNQAAVQLWGREPVIGKDQWCGSFKIFDTDGKTEIPLNQCPMAIALREKRKVIVDTPFIVETPGGERKWFLPNPEPIIDSEGRMTGAINLLFDVTEHKKAEEQQAMLAAIVQSSEDAIVSKTLESIVTSWNPAAEKMFGYAAEEMIGQSITRIIPMDRLDEETRIIELMKRGQSINHFETKRRTKDGRLIDISLTISPVKDSQGNIIGVSKIARDITEQNKLLHALRSKDEQSAKLAAIVHSSDDAIVSETLDGQVTSWNPAAEKMFGYTAGEMIGESIKKIIPHELMDEKPMILEHIRKGISIERLETKRLTKDGKLIDVSLTISPIRDPDGKIIGISKISRDVTIEKRLHEELKEKEEGLRMAMESANLGTWEYSPISYKMICSKESCQICGIPEHMEPSFELILQHIFPEDQELFIEQIKKAIKAVDDGRFDMLLRIYRYHDRQLRWVQAKGKVFFGPDKMARRLIGTMMDVTEAKEREERLSESINLFQTMADTVPAMIWMSGSDKFNDYFNKTWLEYTGRTVEEEANEGWLDNVHPEDVQRCIDNYNESYKQQKGMYTEYRLRRHDGQYRWIADNSVPRYSPDGEFVGFISACMDIDDQKRFREKIRDSELLFKTISNASPTGLWMTDSDGQNVFVNETWINWTGKPFETQLDEGWLSALVEEDKEPTYYEYVLCSREKKYFKAEFRFMRSDGEIRWGLSEGSPYYDSNGEFAGYAGSVTDITELKKLEQRKDDFIKMASHELKTPITSISGYVQLLLNIYAEMEDEKLINSRQTVKSSLQTISKQVSKLTRLISELLDLSKIESGQLELSMREFDLGELVEEVAQDVRHTTTKHAVIVHNDFQGMILGDRDRIGQVILNLLTNAVKYSPDSDNINVFVRNDGSMASVKVKDQGIGVEKKEHQRIFERFYRVEGKSEQTYPGFGIGLFIASEIVQRHKGSISLESEKGKGSEFTVRLPLK